jgi:accessory gene regulator protein AgrB
MLHVLASKTALHYAKRGVISRELTDVYSISFEILYAQIINFLLIVAAAIISKQYIPVGVFMGMFLWMRKYSGGYTPKSHLGCTFLLSIMLLLFVTGLEYLSADVQAVVGLWFLVFTAPVICFRVLVNQLDNPLFKKEKFRLRSNALLVYSFASAVSIISVFFIHGLAFHISSGLFCVAISVMIERARQKHINIDWV